MSRRPSRAASIWSVESELSESDSGEPRERPFQQVSRRPSRILSAWRSEVSEDGSFQRDLAEHFTKLVRIRTLIANKLGGSRSSSDDDEEHRLYVRCLQKTYQLGNDLSILPCGWDAEAGEPHLTETSGWRHQLFCMRSAAMVVHFVYMVVRLVVVFQKSEEMSETKQFHIVLMSIFYGLGPFVEQANFSFRYQLHSHVAKQIKMFKVVAKKVPKSRVEAVASIGELIAFVSILALPSNVTALALHGILFRSHPASVFDGFAAALSWLDLLIPHWVTLILTYVVAGLAQWYVVANIALIGTLIEQVIVNDTMTAMLTLGAIGANSREQGHFGGLQLTSWLTRFRTYQQIALLMNELNHFVEKIAAFVHAIVIIFVVLSIYCVIRIGGFVAAMAGATGVSLMFILVALFDYTAAINNQSQQLLHSWENKAVTWGLWEQLTFRTMKPLKLRISNIYEIDKVTILITIGIITDNVVNILIAD